MNKLILTCLLGTVLVFGDSPYSGSTLAPIAISGGIIAAKHLDTTKKYKRKDCPVCKGKGWYISGDDIKRVDCGYCEPERGDAEKPSLTNPQNCETKVNKK